MSREIMQQALDALNGGLYRSDSIIKAIEALEAELANYEEPLPPVDIGVDVTPEGTHVVACYNKHDAVQEMFYSKFHPLAKFEQEPVAWMTNSEHEYSIEYKFNWLQTSLHDIPLYTAPPRKEWVGLTDDEVNLIYVEPQTHAGQYARAIEAKLKEKNT